MRAATDRTAATARLLRWYERHQRELPWRTASGERGDPYWVLVSELMLQQTQVSVVVQRFVEFIQALPSIEALAAAELDEVLNLWSGLGYYRRARSLHQAAQHVVTAGGFERSAEALKRLPGVGEYTAAAVASIAFGEPVAVLDGNVERVLARVLMESGDPKLAAPRKRLQSAAQRLLDPARPGAFNQAMMELGAVVCRKREPLCEICPLASDCGALATGTIAQFPYQRTKQLRRRRVWTQLVDLDPHADGGRVRLVRRSDEANVLAGKWLLPTEGRDPSERSIAANQANATSPQPTATEVARFQHAITSTDYEIVLVTRQTRPAKPEDTRREQRWVALRDFDANGRWQGRGALPTSSILFKAVVLIRRWRAEHGS